MHHKTRSLSLLALVAALGSPAARAQTILEDIVVTPDRLETEAARTGSTVSVIDGATIEADGRPFALDYLANEPGINVSQTGPAGTISGFTLRGAPQTYTRVLVDGIEISDPTAPQVNPSLSGFPADDIGRIEVLRGSQSAIYGGQAVAGIIDITSPRATEDGIALNYRAEGGSFDSYRGALGLTGRDERGEFALNVTTIDTDGFSAAEAADGNTESDGYSTTRVSASGTLYLSETSAFSGAAFWQTDEGDYDDGPGAGGDAPNTFETETAGARLGLDFESFDQIENSLAVTWFQLDRTQTNAFGPFTSEGDRARIEYLGRYEVSDQWDLRFGADYMRETAETNFSAGSEDLSIAGAFGQAIWSPITPLTLNATLRQDEHSEFGGYTTGRLTGAYLVTPETVLRGSFGTGFRPPSIFELTDAFSGNPDLDPETSTSADLGVERILADGRGNVSATLFWLQIDDLIEYDFNTFTFIQTDGTAESRGLELAAAWTLSDNLALSGAYTYTDSTLPDGERRNRVPRNDLAISLDGSWAERVSYGVTARFVGGYFDESGVDSEGFAEDFVVVNARVGYDLTEEAQIYIRTENLFDEEYQTARGYGTSDQAFYFGVAGTF